MSTTPRPVIGIFGAGKVGIALARLAVDTGYTVHIASSGTAADTAGVTRYFAPGALAADGHDLPALADILIIAVPLRRFRELPLGAMAGHIVIDVMNYWPPIDGTLPDFETADRPTSAIVRDALPASARLVKSFNHLCYHQLEELPRPAGASDRVSLAVAGNDCAAVETVAAFVDDLGFDPVPSGSLEESNMLEANSGVFGQALDQHQLRRTLGIDRAA
jgi:predicted dinucleotide-binding enzyme